MHMPPRHLGFSERVRLSRCTERFAVSICQRCWMAMRCGGLHYSTDESLVVRRHEGHVCATRGGLGFSRWFLLPIGSSLD